MFGLGAPEIMVLLVLGVLLFGRNLPEVGRSLGKTYAEFKIGFKGIESHLENLSNPQVVTKAPVPPEPLRPPQRITTTVPKFEDDDANVHA